MNWVDILVFIVFFFFLRKGGVIFLRLEEVSGGVGGRCAVGCGCGLWLWDGGFYGGMVGGSALEVGDPRGCR